MREKPGDVRAANQRIAHAAKQHRFDRSAGVPFLCECADWACDELIRLTLPQYEIARQSGEFVVAYGHDIPGMRVARVAESYWVLRSEPTA